ncbi:hypothetical protein TELCIR_19747 [Teladorsagia circumcincta]|uniref:Uncharacterized protein n=1 Tax=Teladorsagia circumcincta TaxID=45464 RepID=A0A2G9TLQ4_TELCI|nr:hypothetical protein TELCIR_19747 [Teladorsagia circumcincta]
MSSSSRGRSFRKRHSSKRSHRSRSRSSSTHSSDSERSHKRRRSRRSAKRRDSLERAQNDLPQCEHPCLVCEKPQKSVSFAQPESTIAQRHGVLKKTSRYDEPTEQPETGTYDKAITGYGETEEDDFETLEGVSFENSATKTYATKSATN